MGGMSGMTGMTGMTGMPMGSGMPMGQGMPMGGPMYNNYGSGGAGSHNLGKREAEPQGQYNNFGSGGAGSYNYGSMPMTGMTGMPMGTGMPTGGLYNNYGAGGAGSYNYGRKKRSHAMAVAPGHRFDLHYDDEQADDSKDGFSMIKVINCDKAGDVSDDGTTYQEDIRAVANYLKTYWLSYSDSISGQVMTLSNGEPMDPQCIQQQCEEGEVVCKDVSCIYDGQCLWKTTWDSVGICKYFYFDIGNLKQQTRADRRACIASMLVERWTDSCWQHDDIVDEMKGATFDWWKSIFTVSDEWE